MMSRLLRERIVAGAALAALAMASPVRAQGPGKPTTTSASPSSGSGSGSGTSSGSGSGTKSAPPSNSKLIRQGIGPDTGTTPLAAITDASLLPAGYAAVTVSALSWRGTDASEVDVPVVGVTVGVAPRFQIGASVPYTVANNAAGIPGGWGTTYLNAKIGLVQNDDAGVKLAVAPTIQVLGAGVVPSLSAGESRVTWGLPVSAEFDSGDARLFASGGYFSGGIGFAGGGVGVRATPRVMISGSLSHAWSSGKSTTSIVSPTGTVTSVITDLTNTRSEVSGGLSISVAPHVGVFGSVGHTIGTTDANGAGLTVVAGLSLIGNASGSQP